MDEPLVISSTCQGAPRAHELAPEMDEVLLLWRQSRVSSVGRHDPVCHLPSEVFMPLSLFDDAAVNGEEMVEREIRIDERLHDRLHR